MRLKYGLRIKVIDTLTKEFRVNLAGVGPGRSPAWKVAREMVPSRWTRWMSTTCIRKEALRWPSPGISVNVVRMLAPARSNDSVRYFPTVFVQTPSARANVTWCKTGKRLIASPASRRRLVCSFHKTFQIGRGEAQQLRKEEVKWVATGWLLVTTLLDRPCQSPECASNPI